jgi:AbiV family abortive infection protein
VAAARRNASRLVDDARLLLAEKRWPSAFALAVLAIEESGKEPVIRRILTAEGKPRERAWREFADHRTKNVMAAFVDFVKRGARKLDDFEALIDPKSPHARAVDDLKQSAIYVSATETGWAEPGVVITEQLAQEMVETAERRVAACRERTAEEYRIWKKHVGPALPMGRDATRVAVGAAYEEMARAGLVSDDEARGMIAFIEAKRGGVARQN